MSQPDQPLLTKRARQRLEKYIDRLIDVAAQGNAPPATWIASDIEHIVSQGLLKRR